MFQTFCLAGLFAGITEAILVNPFEVVKVTLQTNKSQRTQAPSTMAVTREIIRTQVFKSFFLFCFSLFFYVCVFNLLNTQFLLLQGLGLKGLNKGVTATIARNGVFNMVYFGFYHSVKGLFPQVQVIPIPILTLCYFM